MSFVVFPKIRSGILRLEKKGQETACRSPPEAKCSILSTFRDAMAAVSLESWILIHLPGDRRELKEKQQLSSCIPPVILFFLSGRVPILVVLARYCLSLFSQTTGNWMELILQKSPPYPLPLEGFQRQKLKASAEAPLFWFPRSLYQCYKCTNQNAKIQTRCCCGTSVVGSGFPERALRLEYLTFLNLKPRKINVKH